MIKLKKIKNLKKISMSFHAHFLYTDGMREYFVQIVPDVPEILSFAQKEVKIK